MHFLPLLTLAFLSAVAVVRALPVERDAQKDELVTQCIIEALSNALSKPNTPPVTSECREILKRENHEVAENKFEGANNYYEEHRHLENFENPPYENKGSQRAVEEYKRTYYEEGKKSDDEHEEKHYRQNHEEEKSEVNNSDEDSRSIEGFYPVKNFHHVRGHGDHHSNQEYEERRYADKRSDQDNEGRYRKHSEEETTHEWKGSQKADSTESTINVSHHKQQDIRSQEGSSEEDKQFGIHRHSKERRLGRIDTGTEGSDEDFNHQYKINGHYEHKKFDPEELEEKDSEEGEKLHNDPMHYQRRNNYGHSDEDRSVHQDKDSDISDKSSEDLEHIKSIHNYLKRNKNQVEYEDKINRHSRSSSEESKEEKHLYKRSNSEVNTYSEEEEKRHLTDYKRQQTEEVNEKDEDKKKYYSEEKQHNSEEKRNSLNEAKHHREESPEERYTSNGKDEDEERNTELFPKAQRFWWKKRHSLEERNPGSEEEIKPSQHGHFYPKYEEQDDKRQRTDYEKRQKEEGQGQNEETDEDHPIRQNFNRDFQGERMYDRMDKLAHYLKSMEIPKLHDSEEEKGKQNHNEEKKKMNHRALIEEEEKELKNLAAMDLELEKMAEKLHDNQRD